MKKILFVVLGLVLLSSGCGVDSTKPFAPPVDGDYVVIKFAPATPATAKVATPGPFISDINVGYEPILAYTDGTPIIPTLVDSVWIAEVDTSRGIVLSGEFISTMPPGCGPSGAEYRSECLAHKIQTGAGTYFTNDHKRSLDFAANAYELEVRVDSLRQVTIWWPDDLNDGNWNIADVDFSVDWEDTTLVPPMYLEIEMSYRSFLLIPACDPGGDIVHYYAQLRVADGTVALPDSLLITDSLGNPLDWNLTVNGEPANDGDYDSKTRLGYFDINGAWHQVGEPIRISTARIAMTPDPNFSSPY